jgi:hypothetical protein
MNCLGIIILFSLILIPIDSKKSYYEIVCEDIKECTHLCDEESRDQRKSKLQLPHYGLTSFRIKTNTRIVGGKDAQQNQYPWAVSLRYRPNSTETKKPERQRTFLWPNYFKP